MNQKYYKSIFIISILFFSLINFKNACSQTAAKIENTSLETDRGRLIITYDLVDTKPNERFNVWIDISKSSGQEIKARNISGHVGNNIVGGKGLNIIWDYEGEGMDINEEINIQVMAELVTVHNLKIERVLVKSAVFPGWGLYDMDKVSPYLLIGVAGYGTLATTLIYNGKSNNIYQEYLDANDDEDEARNLWDDYTKKVNMTNLMGITTAAIWVLDLGWSAVRYIGKTSKLNAGLDQNIHIGYDYDAYGQVPMLSIKYNF
jgi:hypothetical protein